MLGRVSHLKLGLGVCLDEFKTEGGKQAVRVIFDSQPNEERTLAEFVTPSEAPLPDAAKKAAKKNRVTKKPKPAPISDSLLMPYLDEGTSRHFEQDEAAG